MYTTGHLHHIEIHVSDLSKTKTFWGPLLEKMQYTKYQEWEQGASWKLGAAYIVFVQTEERYLDRAYHRKRVGLNHLAFHVESVEKLEEIKSLLFEMDATTLYGGDREFFENYHAFYFEDPDRIKVELVVAG